MFRIGTGYDLHRLVDHRKLVLGGVEIPFDKGLEGHSDADVLLHAITDALLGAVAAGNIGMMFPDTDPAHKDAAGADLLGAATDAIKRAGYLIVNIDATIVAQAPKLNPHLPAIRESIADILALPLDAVSVKPKTNEGVGPEGRGEAISAWASVLVRARES